MDIFVSWERKKVNKVNDLLQKSNLHLSKYEQNFWVLYGKYL